MKRLLIVIFAAFGLFELAYAVGPAIWKSSNTTTADTFRRICSGNGAIINGSTVTWGNHGVLHSICVNTGTNNGTVTVYDSSVSATSPIAAVSTSTGMPCSLFDVGTSSALSYDKTGVANVTITYDCW